VGGLLHRLRSRPWLALTMACAGIALRAAIPVGFMPAPAGQSSAAMVICPGHAMLPPDTAQGSDGEKPGKAGGDRPVPCQFAFAAGNALQAEVATLASPPAPELPALLAITATPRSTHAARSHGARDPPSGSAV
jgi:hypothetical protein